MKKTISLLVLFSTLLFPVSQTTLLIAGENSDHQSSNSKPGIRWPFNFKNTVVLGVVAGTTGVAGGTAGWFIGTDVLNVHPLACAAVAGVATATSCCYGLIAFARLISRN